MPRTFTHIKLVQMTMGKLTALPPEDQRAYWAALDNEWALRDEAYLDGDYEQVGSYQRYELGE